jgi:tetratricopeptide (TPR) repeat protein
MIAFGWQHLEGSSPARTLRLASALAAMVLVAGGVRSAVRNPVWKDTDAVWDALVEDHPESYRAQHINAARMLERGNRELAREYVALGIRLWPNDAPSLHTMARFEIEVGNHRRAIEMLDQALAIAPYVGNYQIARAYAYLALEEPRPALEALNRAATLDAPRRAVQALRAQAYERLGRHDHAVGAWRAAIGAPGPSPWSVWALLARELARTGDRAEALAAAESAIGGTSADDRRHAVALRDAIGRGCYDDGGSTDSDPATDDVSSCDPLAGWGVLVPVSQPENARTLQNARRDTTDAPSEPAEG